ncbi:MAG: ABC transporter ATP-binding protein [Anaerolineaceae bacterium]|nr:ABC transporter ATP-binding protein [Anaerolineaceae bacterium]
MSQHPNNPVSTIANLRVCFPAKGADTLNVIGGLSFQVYPHEFLSILGPSGCGKTTLLRVIAGLLSPGAGNVAFTSLPDSSKPAVGLVFQQANLMPWRTVYSNISLPLEIAGYPPGSYSKRIRELIHLVGLDGFGDSYPRDLSGGMLQRVAIARALIHDPALMLLDEPFGPLDALTRERMGVELLNIWQVSRKTVIMVTHSISEAVFLSDRVIVLSPRPALINLDLRINLPRPRDENTRYQPQFGRLAKTLRKAIVEEQVT